MSETTIGVNIFTDVETRPRHAVIYEGQRLAIDGVECVVVIAEPDGITTRPLTDAD